MHTQLLQLRQCPSSYGLTQHSPTLLVHEGVTHIEVEQAGQGSLLDDLEEMKGGITVLEGTGQVKPLEVMAVS